MVRFSRFGTRPFTYSPARHEAASAFPGHVQKADSAALPHSLDCIVTKLKETSEAMIHSIVIFMNLRKRLRLLLRSLFSWLRFMIQSLLLEADFALA